MEPTGQSTGAGRGRRRRAAEAEAAWDSSLPPEERIEQLLRRVERLEGQPGLRERGRSVLDRVVPPEAATHFRNAGREQLLGIRSIVDFWIERLESAEDRANRRGGRTRETIEIE